MPCYTPDYGPTDAEILERKIPAVLCAILRAHGPSVLDGVDWKEAGVSHAEFSKWWKCHEQEDAERRRREAEYQTVRTKRADALAKLTPEERAIIGVPDGD